MHIRRKRTSVHSRQLLKWVRSLVTILLGRTLGGRFRRARLRIVEVVHILDNDTSTTECHSSWDSSGVRSGVEVPRVASTPPTTPKTRNMPIYQPDDHNTPNASGVYLVNAVADPRSANGPNINIGTNTQVASKTPRLAQPRQSSAYTLPADLSTREPNKTSASENTIPTHPMMKERAENSEPKRSPTADTRISPTDSTIPIVPPMIVRTPPPFFIVSAFPLFNRYSCSTTTFKTSHA